MPNPNMKLTSTPSGRIAPKSVEKVPVNSKLQASQAAFTALAAKNAAAIALNKANPTNTAKMPYTGSTKVQTGTTTSIRHQFTPAMTAERILNAHAAAAAAAYHKSMAGKNSVNKVNSLGNKVTPSAAGSSNPPKVILQEFSVRVPKTNVRPISIMRFNGALNIDIANWTNVKMSREDNSKMHKVTTYQEEDMPKFGAGSEYGREAREEARRRKYGVSKRKFNIDDQPWILKLGDKINRKYKGVRDGGLTQNASYFIFTQAADGGFEVFPVQQWYNFSLIQRYKCLSAEEAEEEFGKRNKIMNYFSLMVKKRMQADDADEDGEKGSGKSAGKKSASSSLKVSEMDDWEDSEKEDDSEPEDEDEEDKKKKKKNTGPKKDTKKKKKDSDDEAFEDSDDGDGEGREMDYISDTSETESEEEKEKKNELKGVDQEQGMKRLLDSDEETSEEENKEEKEEEKDDEPGPSSKDDKANPEQKDKKKKKKKKKKTVKKDSTENLSDEDNDKEDKNAEDIDNMDSVKLESGSSGNNSGNSRDGTPDFDYIGGKRKASSDPLGGTSNPASKKPKIEMSSAMLQSAASEGITEDSVRRYLARKPMTATELLQKFKSKKTKISSHDMVNVIAHLLKKINPVKRMQNQKMYLFLSTK